HYSTDNILSAPSSPAHSGPELYHELSDSIHAEKLAREIVLDRLSIVSNDRPSLSSSGGSIKGLKLDRI
ncbi:MAG: hypothetical protein Q8919_09500, partial [Bacteroidota bacterium]|nr:hypothetical protein [Bacteroidota bacterium]